MKIDHRRADAFVGQPGTCRAVLLYGEDEGLIRHYAARLVRAVAGSLDDPFRVAELDGASHARLAEEAATLALTGGRRAIRVREVTDVLAKTVQAFLAGRSDALLVLEAPGIAARSRLRSLLEAAPDGAALGCYAQEGTDLIETVRAALRADGITIEPDAARWLAGQLGADRASTSQELAKLALFAGPGGRIDQAMAAASVGDMAGLSGEDAIFAATEGDLSGTDRALELALAEGMAPVALLRAALGHVQRLHRLALVVEAGSTVREAIAALKPPLFFKIVPHYVRALDLWTASATAVAAAALSDADRACKRTGAPADLICRNTVLTLARRAQAARR